MNTPAKILVAEDEPITRGLFKAILENAGYEVILVEDGVAAVEKAASEHPDLVITDGLLPKLHGFLVCQEIKALDPAPKVIISTAIYTKMTYKWEVKNKYQSDDLLIKPVSPADLLQCVEKHLGAPATPTGMASKSINQKDTPKSKEECEGRVLDGAELRDGLTSLQTP
ncbi:MAG TPA: response regulator [Blastocatellia bacterium]|nr:response regulator [Blastocatellia bacterium]